MSIQRFGVGPRMSDVIIHNNTLYTVEVPINLEADFIAQTKEVLAGVEQTLIDHGSDKSKLLMVTIYLPDINDRDAFNDVWDAWVVPGHTPIRCCVQATLAKAGYRLEAQVMAAV